MTLIVAHVSDAGVHLPRELGHMGQHTDCPGHPTPGMKHQVLAVVSTQQLHVLSHPENSQLELSISAVSQSEQSIIKHLMGQIRSIVKRRKKVEAMDQTMITNVARVWIPRR